MAIVEHFVYYEATYCRVTSGLNLEEWVKKNVAKTTRWRWGLQRAAKAAGQVQGQTRKRTCKSCGQRWTRETGHSFHRGTKHILSDQRPPEEDSGAVADGGPRRGLHSSCAPGPSPESSAM
ncbi:hypothetical protein VZT92_023000 [Zoarces viviparus]|uniref:C2H2-type domain-containing protein n=1 Tax=Zoarces viviparus TaxID=48416 RepID=A0AAW1E779_ZOAVI